MLSLVRGYGGEATVFGHIITSFSLFSPWLQEGAWINLDQQTLDRDHSHLQTWLSTCVTG